MNRVFVYGSLMSGMGNHGMMAEAKLIGACHALPGQYQLRDLGPFPAVEFHYDGTSIQGELYEISDELLACLDRFEGCPDHYRRGIVMTSVGFAWIYLLSGEPHGTVIESGDWRSHLSEKEKVNV